ncbi:MAG: MFS transporter, partial [Candidatus Lindowbacteria bacterium]|nr:MFS transporter [Candidatus Lindowbacteria bacterium]
LLPHAGPFPVVVVISGLMYFFIGFAQAPYLSLLPDVTPAHQRSTASGVMYLMGGIGLASYFIVGSAIWEEHTVAVFYMVAAVSFGAAFVTIAFVREPGRTQCESSEGTRLLEYLRSVARETNVLKYLLAQFFCWMGVWMVSAFLTLFMVEELNLAEGKSLMVMMAFSLTATASTLPLGILGDRLGRKGIFSCMLGFWVAGLIFVGFSHSLPAVLVTVVLTGIPLAAVMAIGYVYTLDIIPKEHTGQYLGLYSISISVPQIFGPVIGGKLIDTVGYRSIFCCSAAFMAVGLIILQFTKPRREAATLAIENGDASEIELCHESARLPAGRTPRLLYWPPRCR